VRLKKLELFGFKSFPEKLAIEIGDGIMAIVGPNGCGKSNIVDAIRWGLGEQSARILRGESMGDVIFAGSKTRKPLGMAQVELTFSNEDGRLPVDYSEVTVCRRVFRSGESEYLLNKDPCRLKDIKEMFRGTGVGSHSYSLIERAQIESVITDGAADRRLLLEEAAGITNYKARKREALRKLEATENDLIRLNDIISEVERETRSLGRQVGKAKRYQRYSSRVKELDVQLSYRKYKGLAGSRRELEEELTQRRAEEAALQGRRAAIEAGAETLRAELLQRGRDVSQVERSLREAEGRIARTRERISVLTERRRGLEERARAAEAEAAELAERIERERKTARELEESDGERREELERLRSLAAERERELHRVEDRLAEARSALEEVRRPAMDSVELVAQLGARLQRHSAQLAERKEAIAEGVRRREELLSRKAELSGALERGRAELEDLLEVLQKCRSEEEERAARTESLWEEANTLRERENELSELAAGLQSRLRVLRELRDSYEGLGEGVMLIMKDESLRREAAIAGPLAGLLTVPDRYAPAVEGVLGETLRYLVSEDPDRAARVLAATPPEKAPGVPVVAPPQGRSRLDEAARERILGDERVREWLPAACGCEDPTTRRFLENAFVARDERAALDLAREHEGLIFVTLGGFAVESGAKMVRTGGARGTAALMCRRGEIERCESELQRTQGDLESVRRKRVEIDSSRSESLEALEEMRQRGRSLQQACFDKEKEISTARAQLQSCEEELERLEAGITSLERAVEESSRKASEVQSSLQAAESEKERRGMELQAAEAMERTLDAARDEAQASLQEVRSRLAEAESALREVKAEAARLAASAVELEGRREAKEREAEEEREAAASLAEELASLGRELEEARAEASAFEERLAGVKEEFSRVEEELESKEKEAREARAKAEEATERVHEAEIRLTQVSTEESALKTRVLAEHGVDLDAYEPPGDVETDLGEMESELAQLKEKLARLGAVNLLAVEDYRKSRERLQFLTTQRDDLVKAREELLEAIEKINVTASSLFMETFEKVRRNFKETFATLFKDGEAELSLVGDDPLEAEIEIQARPGGKKLQNIKLLSGGERALAALSLLFAVYLVKPSPFCILDEVDAPLDDANVEKFIAMIQKFSARTQFIIITHNKMTMEAADRLYGITMPEPGTSKLVSVKFDERGELATSEAESAAAMN